ncbi:MAG: hypothetical protein CM15mP21_4720 [Hyphomicrobiales bacterium]|nr:MAG: hypothetical protein CM15mP21_4720 [Hyphomicrobiales bacterium]
MPQTLKLVKKHRFSCAADGAARFAADFAGKTCIYFYPKNDTPGCTTKRLNLQPNMTPFRRQTEIVGVSADSVEKHEKFKTKHNLGVTLLSDPDQKCSKPRRLGGKNMYGRKYMGIERATFLVGEDAKF